MAFAWDCRWDFLLRHFVELIAQLIIEDVSIFRRRFDVRMAQQLLCAQDMAKMNAGAVAFSRRGDPSTGDFEPAEVLGRYGDVPADETFGAE